MSTNKVLRNFCLICTIITVLTCVYSKNTHATEKYVLFILDTSNSMSGSKINSAKKTLIELIDREIVGTEIAVRVFNQNPINKEDSCKNSDLLLDFDNYEPQAVRKILDEINVHWQTPLEQTLKEAEYDFYNDNKDHEIILITDGEDTCDGDPCYRATFIRKQLGVKIHVIAINVDNKAKKQLICIAESTGGKFFNLKSHSKIDAAAYEILELPIAPLIVILKNLENQKVLGYIEVYNEYGDMVAKTPVPLREFSPSLPVGEYTIYVRYKGQVQVRRNVKLTESEQNIVNFIFETKKEQ